MRFKNIFIFIMAAMFVFAACDTKTSQTTETPDLGVSDEPIDSDVQEFNIDGMTVLYKPSTNNVINVKLFINGGMGNYSMEEQGVEAMMLSLMANSGTKKYPKTVFNAMTESLGTSISGAPNYDYSTFTMQCVKRNFEESWDIYKEAVLNPDWNQKEFDLTQERMITAAKQAQTDPDGYLRRASMEYTFKGKNYAKDQNGTPESLENLQLENVKNHYQKVLTRSQVQVVIVGNLTPEEVKAKVKEITSALPQGSYTKPREEPITITQPSINIIERDIKTNYLRGYMNGPAYGSEDEIAMRLAMSMLHDRLWKEIRTKRSLSYAPSAFYPSGITGNPYTAVYVSTDDPNQCAEVIIDEIRGLKKNGFTEKELKDKKATFITWHYMGMETNSSQTENLGRANTATHWSQTEMFIQEVERVDISKLNETFNRYAQAIEWTYLGKSALIDKTIFEQEL